MTYRLVRALTRLLLWLFYCRVEVVGRERIPAEGGVIVAANHHNSVVDAMVIVAVLPRPVMVLANAPLFRHPLIGPFLRLMGALPVQRRAEAGDDPRKNDAMFAAAIGALRRGGVILIFPEGRTQPQPMLLPLRTGAARMMLGAVTAGEGEPVTLLPVGIVFHDPGTFRSGSVQVMIGTPVPAADLVSAHRERPEEAVRLLTARLTEGIRARIVEAEDQYTLELLAVLGVEQSLSWKQRVPSVWRIFGDGWSSTAAASSRSACGTTGWASPIPSAASPPTSRRTCPGSPSACPWPSRAPSFMRCPMPRRAGS
ncbi:MAG: hypothetical protein DMF82_25350 [Acidobacteria bacterium]|nr:MAG: hypothetical protein DMF82_25350 [Acidobacteriota bacterium]